MDGRQTLKRFVIFYGFSGGRKARPLPQGLKTCNFVMRRRAWPAWTLLSRQGHGCGALQVRTCCLTHARRPGYPPGHAAATLQLLHPVGTETAKMQRTMLCEASSVQSASSSACTARTSSSHHLPANRRRRAHDSHGCCRDPPEALALLVLSPLPSPSSHNTLLLPSLAPPPRPSACACPPPGAATAARFGIGALDFAATPSSPPMPLLPLAPPLPQPPLPRGPQTPPSQGWCEYSRHLLQFSAFRARPGPWGRSRRAPHPATAEPPLLLCEGVKPPPPPPLT